MLDFVKPKLVAQLIYNVMFMYIVKYIFDR
jgi:hypothetical protein